MTTFFAQPYDISATGFYFDSFDDYQAKARASQNDYGQPIEEFEIQFIDGDDLDAAFADAFGINQANIARFINLADEWGDDEKTRFIIAIGECGYARSSSPWTCRCPARDTVTRIRECRDAAGRLAG